MTEEAPFVSRLLPPQPHVKHPSDLLSERRTFMRRLHPTQPSIADFIRHAERFGTDFVVETAVEVGHGLDACVRLQDTCDRLAPAAFRKERPRAPLKKPPPAEERVKALLGLDKEDGGD